jgi:hypothetical protein
MTRTNSDTKNVTINGPINDRIIRTSSFLITGLDRKQQTYSQKA